MLSTLTISAISGLLVGGVYAILAVGFSITMGSARVINLAHPTLALVCSYLAYYLVGTLEMDPVLALAILVPIMFILGLAFYYGLLRPIIRRVKEPQMATAVLTLGVAMILENLLAFSWKSTERMIKPSYSGHTIQFPGVPVQLTSLLAFTLGLACLLAVYVFLRRTRTGKAIQAIAQQPEAARLYGIRVDRTAAIAVAISMATAAVAGVAMGLIFAFTPASQIVWLLWVLLVVVISGVGTVRGVLFAGLIIGGIIGVVGALIPYVWLNLVLFGGLIIVVLTRPKGLFRF